MTSSDPREDRASALPRRIQSVERMLTIFSNLGPQGLTVAQLAERTRIPAPTVARLLKTAQFAGYVERLPHGGYVPGPALFSMAITLDRGALLRRVIDEEMTALRDSVDETVGLYVRKGAERYCVHSVESRQPIRRGHTVGQRMPLYTGAAGRVFLAFAKTPGLFSLVPKQYRTPAGELISLEELRAQAEEAKANGFAFYRGHVNTEAWGLAAPVLVRETLYATLVVSAPVTRMDTIHVNRTKKACLLAARRISDRISLTFGPRASLTLAHQSLDEEALPNWLEGV